MFVDSHAHIDGEEFDADRDEVVARARAAGVRAVLNVGTGDPHGGDLERAVAVAEKYEGVYAAVGVHPHDARLYDEEAERRLLSIVRRGPPVVALGGRRNEPAYVVETARFLAELRGVGHEELGRVTSENFARFFGLDLT